MLFPLLAALAHAEAPCEPVPEPSHVVHEVPHEGPASSHDQVMAHEHSHDHRPHGLVEIRAINGASFAEGRADHVVGTGLSVELYALHHQLGFEVATAALTSGVHSIVPFEFIVKKPFQVSDDVEPYVGVGPMLVGVLDEDAGWHPGAVAAIGTALWAGPHLAMVIETNGSLAHLGDGTHADIEALASIAYRY